MTRRLCSGLCIILWLALSVSFASAQSEKAPEKSAKAATVISARTDKTGQHPGTAPVGGPSTVTCTSATSDIPRPQPPPSCFIVAPGFSGNLNRGQSAGTSGAGTVTLTCNGQGNILTCSATVR